MAQLVHSIFQNGYHPVSDTTISFNKTQCHLDCSIYLYFFLPPLIFVDPYELVHYEASYAFRHWGTSNLELPVSAVSQNGSYLLLNVHHTANEHEVHVKVPLHLRYGDLSKDQLSSYHTVDLAWPIGFFECPLTSEAFLGARLLYLASSLSVICSGTLSVPSLGMPRLPHWVSSLFDSQSAHLLPITHHGSGSPDFVRVPIGTLNDLIYVEFGTLFTIWASFFYLLKASRSTFRRMNRAVFNKTD